MQQEIVKGGKAHFLFEHIFFSTKSRLFSYIRKFLSERMDAEDIFQQCYLKLWENIDQVEVSDDALPLLFTYAKHLVADYYRKEAVKTNFLLAQQSAAPASQFPNEHIDIKEYRQLLKRALDKLPEISRKVFILKREHGLSYAQIAQQLSVTPSAVENHMSRALKVLKKEFGSGLNVYVFLYLLQSGSQSF